MNNTDRKYIKRDFSWIGGYFCGAILTSIMIGFMYWVFR